MIRLSENIVKRLGGLRFDHKRLVAFQVALDALLRGEALLDTVPRGHAPLVDQTRRALEGGYLNTSEGAGKFGPARLVAFRIAETEASEAGAGFEALLRLGHVEHNEAMAVLELLDRQCGLLTGLAHLRR
jgi:hypothetical protein